MADLDARSVGNMRQNAQNAEQTKVIRNSNNFPLDYSHPTTHRYADIDLFYHYFAERGDTVPLRTGHTIHTATFSSPNELDIYMRKQFCHIPMKAIYPRTWDHVLYPLPVDGDTAPLDGRANFPIVSYVKKLVDAIEDSKVYLDNTRLGGYLYLIDSLANIVSNGSLFSKLNIHLSSLVRGVITAEEDGVRSYLSYDRFVSNLYTELSNSLRGRLFKFTQTVDGVPSYTRIYFGSEYENSPSFGGGISSVSSWHQLHDYIKAFDYQLEIEGDPFDFSYFQDFYSLVFYNYGNPDDKINIEPLIAYQLCCAQFYTNDRVDNVYSSVVYTNYIQYLYSQCGLSTESFIFNDVEYLYDIFSEHYFNKLVDLFVFDDVDFNVVRAINQLFSYRSSLRFGDYFLGARVSALAVGESSIPVTGDGVLVEDVTRSAALQRLRYNINVLGRKINNQLMGLIPGLAPNTPDDIPTSIASQDFNIGKDRQTVANTGEAQVSTDPKNSFPITQHLYSGSSDFAFKIQITEPCIILGLVSFSVPRIYSRTIDRFAFHHDRYDMFIPQMQFIGDQEIYRKELFGLNVLAGSSPFAYNQRYSEYKQRYSYASGAFIEFLKSWEMITDNTEGLLSTSGFNINSNFSHSVPSEFDRFYKSVSGNSLADYYHFVVKHYNTSTPTRAMAWNPEPLL